MARSEPVREQSAGHASSPTQWEHDIEMGEPSLVARLSRLTLLTTVAYEQIAARSKVSYADYLILAVVRRSADGRTTPSRICEILHRPSGGMTLSLDRLEAEGLLTRAADTADRRRVIIELSPRGRAIAIEVNQALHRWEDELPLGGLPRRLVTGWL